MVPTPLKTLVPNASNSALSLMRDLMLWNPAARPNVVQSLRHQYFSEGGPLPEVPETQTKVSKQTL